MYKLLARPGSGSVAVEALLAELDIPHQVILVERDAENRLPEIIHKLNPMGQVPTLVLPSGEVMTESAAMTLHLADLAGRDDLVPGPGAAERAAFLRWLVFIVANIYPTFTYADVPTRFVADAAAAEAFRARVEAHAEGLWRIAGDAARGPWFLGERFSALDIYVGVMRHWRPGEAWFEANTPRLAVIGRAVEARAGLAEVFRRNFG